jgi:hypothetical protein
MVHGTRYLRFTTVILTGVSILMTAALSLARVCGIISWDWRWIVAPAAIVLASWAVIVLMVLATTWIVVRIGKDIP